MWVSFMDGVVREVCAALGVNFDASKPRCDLYKLLVYETGSQYALSFIVKSDNSLIDPTY